MRARVTRSCPIGKSSPTLDTAGWEDRPGLDGPGSCQLSCVGFFALIESGRGEREIDRHEFSFFSDCTPSSQSRAASRQRIHSELPVELSARARQSSRDDVAPPPPFSYERARSCATPLLRARRRGGTRRVTHETRPRTPGTATECPSSPVARRGARPRVSSVARRARASPAFFRRSRVTSPA